MLTWYFRALRRFTRLLIRFVLSRRKEQDDDDYVHAGKAMRLDQIPIRSTTRDGKRAALEYARHRTGNPRLRWGQARKRLQRWEREEREANARGRRGRAGRRDGRVAAGGMGEGQEEEARATG